MSVKDKKKFKKERSSLLRNGQQIVSSLDKSINSNEILLLKEREILQKIIKEFKNIDFDIVARFI